MHKHRVQTGNFGVGAPVRGAVHARSTRARDVFTLGETVLPRRGITSDNQRQSLICQVG